MFDDKMKGFISAIARQKYDGEECEEGEAFKMENGHAEEALSKLIRQARAFCGHNGKRYRHMLTVAFTVESDNDGEHLTADELLAGLGQRYRDLYGSGDEIIEACGLPDDTDDSQES